MSVKQWMSVDVKERMKAKEPVQIIDVREPYEFQMGHIPGAKSIPLSQLQHRHTEIDHGIETVIVCLSGGRSHSACHFLEQVGHPKLVNLMGGMSAWDGEVVM